MSRFLSSRLDTVSTRRSRGEGGPHYSDSRQRWIATAHVGFRPDGKRIVKRASGKTKTEAKSRLRDILRDLDDGIGVQGHQFTVEDALRDWLAFGLNGRDRKTIEASRILIEHRIIPGLGRRRLRELTADDVDSWLAEQAATASRSTLSKLLSILRRAIDRQMARDRVKRNVALLCQVPSGQPGRASKALTLAQARALLTAAEGSDLNAYISLSLLTGARNQRAARADMEPPRPDRHPDAAAPIPPTVQLWRSVRAHGDTKTKLSRRTPRLPARCVNALTTHLHRQLEQRRRAGLPWSEADLVFATR